MSNYITHEPIYRELEGKFSNKRWNEEDVYRWCQQVVNVYIADPDTMFKYLQVPLSVSNKGALLPANVSRLLDVYWVRNYKEGQEILEENTVRLKYNRMDRVLKQLHMNGKRFEEDVVWVNYIGAAIDTKSCMPLIFEPYYPACETFCKIQGFEAEMLMGKINGNLYFDWKQRFDLMIQGVKSDMKLWDSQEYANMTIIMGNEIPKIGYQPLAHKYTGDGVI
jgi:hypothetical protein